MRDSAINNHINDLCRQASGLAPRFSDDNLGSCCSGPWPEGPRQYRAFLRLQEAFRLNATL